MHQRRRTQRHAREQLAGITSSTAPKGQPTVQFSRKTAVARGKGPNRARTRKTRPKTRLKDRKSEKRRPQRTPAGGAEMPPCQADSPKTCMERDVATNPRKRRRETGSKTVHANHHLKLVRKASERPKNEKRQNFKSQKQASGKTRKPRVGHGEGPNRARFRWRFAEKVPRKGANAAWRKDRQTTPRRGSKSRTSRESPPKTHPKDPPRGRKWRKAKISKTTPGAKPFRSKASFRW